MDVNKDTKEIDLLDFWRVALKRKWIIMACVIAILVAAGVYTFTSTPLYRATATILLENPSSNMLNIDEIFNYSSGSMGAYFNTQLRLLKSRSLAERVAKRMNLAIRPELHEAQETRMNLIQTVKDFALRWIVPKRDDPGEDSEFVFEKDPNFRLASMVSGGLGVEPEEGTSFVRVSYTFPHPVLAADIVNTAVEEFIDYSVEMRYAATQQASEFLSEQIVRINDELEAKEKEIQKYGEEKDLLFLNEKESTVVSKFAELNRAYTGAQIERINKETIYRELKKIDIDSMYQHVSNSFINSLYGQYIQMKTEYAQKRNTLKADYPEMMSLQARMNSTKAELRSEIQKALKAAQSNLETAREKEASFGRVLEEQRRKVLQMNSNAILYNSLQIEVDNKRTLVNSLDSQQNETLVSARLRGLKTSNIKIIDKALVPGGPIAPNKKRNMILALMLGLFFGAGLAFFVDYLDNTVKGPEEVEKLVGLPALGIIPIISSNNSKKKYTYYSNYISSYGEENPDEKESIEEVKEIELINHLFPKLTVSEDYRTVRTSILFSHADNPPRSIAFTSSFPQEGKTATITNTAISFAQLEKKVLLIDADLRKPRLHKIFEARNRIGLSSYLIGLASIDNAIMETSVENVWLLPSGPHPPNPAELINSKKMEELLEIVKSKFDIVFIDTPPVLAVIDPIVISSISDAVVLVLREGKTSRRPLVKAVKEIRRANGQIIGIVYNEVRVNRKGYYSPYYQNYYMYSYDSEQYVDREEAD